MMQAIQHGLTNQAPVSPVAVRQGPPGLPPESASYSVTVARNLLPSPGADAGHSTDPAVAGRLR